MKGQSLIEVLVVIGIISLILTGIARVVTYSIGNTQFSSDQVNATKFAQEGLEVTRNIRNGNFPAFVALSGGRYCLGTGATSLGTVRPITTSCPQNLNDVNGNIYYIRSIDIEHTPGCGPNVTKVVATVAWTDGKCQAGSFCHKSQLESCLSRVNPVQAP